MSDRDSVTPNIYQLLNQAVGGDIENYSISVGEGNKKGEGFSGDLHFVSLTHKGNGKTFPLVIKQGISNEKARQSYYIRDYFLNEIYFYETVWPAFEKFQKEVLLSNVFDKIPKCFATSTEDRNELVILENLKLRNFQMVDKRVAVDADHFEFIFKEYGKFHALSFAYQQKNPKEYSDMSQGLRNLYLLNVEKQSFKNFLHSIHKLCLESLDPVSHAKVIEKYKDYLENGVNIFKNSFLATGDHSVVLHGDCWSNNMMFKHDASGKPIDIRLIDFQIAYRGNPVSDLSYCLYGGGSKEIYDKLDYFLKVYHDSLMETLENIGCDTRNVYSMEDLKQNWKQYCKIGFTMGLVIWRAKLVEENDAVNLSDLGNGKVMSATRFDEKYFKKIAKDMVLHMYENDFL